VEQRVLPEPHEHVNNEVRAFLSHFKSDRLIQISCDKELARKRDEREKEQILEEKEKEMDRYKEFHEHVLQQREEDKTERE